jgi:hypothetical protein
MRDSRRQAPGEAVIEGRFNGPPASANGGYACGALARFVSEPAEVTLRLPPPLDHPMQVVEADGGVRLLDGESVVAEGRPVDGVPVEPPIRPTLAEAEAARERHPGRGKHFEMSDCVVCSPHRADSLGVSCGPLEQDPDVGVAPFVPDESVAEDGIVRPEVVWAVLDCPSFPQSLWSRLQVAMLGRMSAERLRDVQLGERLVALGWPIEADGRKRITGSAILDADGGIVARARATWIEPRATG